MNKKLKIGLMLLNSSRDRGFAMPLALGMGLVMLLVAATMIVRSQGDRITANAQTQTAQSLAAAEAGISRTLSILNQPGNDFLLSLTYDPSGITGSAVNQWNTTGFTNAGLPCPNQRTVPTDLSSSTTQDTTVGSSGGTYRLRAYRFNNNGTATRTDDTGTLVVEGKQRNGASRLNITIPVVQIPKPNSFPGLFASNIVNLGNNDVLTVTGGTGASANVICEDCVIDQNQCTANGPTQQGLNNAVGRGANSNVAGDIFISNPNIPAVPTAPTTVCSATSGPDCRIAITGAQDLPRTSDTTQRAAWITAAVGNTNNPWSQVGAASQPYHYVVGGFPVGNSTVTIDTTTAPVYLYVSGDITLSGQGTIAHTTGTADRFRIYGNPADPTNAVADQRITLSGGSTASNVFVFAPDAIMGINGGSGSPDIRGAVWTKTWDGSSSNNADIAVPDNMPNLLGGLFSSAGVQANQARPTSAWQRNATN